MLDKGSNYIFPTIESRANEGFTMTEKERRQLKSILKVDATGSSKKSQQKTSAKRYSRAEQLRRGVQSGMIHPARILPSIDSPAPHVLL